MSGSSLMNLSRWGALPFLLGGPLWSLAYVLDVVVGVRTGQGQQDPSSSPLAWLAATAFVAAAFCVGLGLLGLLPRLQGRARGLAIAGAVFAGLATVAAAINLVMLSGVTGSVSIIGPLGALGVVGNCIGSMLLGLAARRAGTLAPRASRLLPWIGPLLVALLFLSFASFIPLPVPPYVVDNLPFGLIGGVWFAFGLRGLAG